METKSSIPSDILKLQKKLCEYEIDSRNYNKYKKILSKHIKKHAMKRRVNSNIKTIKVIQNLENS